MNVFTFTGNLGRAPELRTTQGGTPVLNFAVANEVGFGDRKKTQWVDCALFGKRADSLERHLAKGSKVTVSGELSLETYQKRDGNQSSKLSVNVNEVALQGGAQEPQPTEPPRTQAPGNGLDDEIPF